jgi:hypothetical protein
MVVNGDPIDDDDAAEEAAPRRDQEDEDWYDSIRAFEARLEARMDGGYRSSTAPFRAAFDGSNRGAKTNGAKINGGPFSPPKTNPKPDHRSLKKPTKKQISQGMPPTPRGFEWRPSDEGWSLWRCWSEWDDGRTERIKKSRYTGHLSQGAWEIMKKEYDNEAYISTIGERIRRHSGRQSVRSV